MKTSLLARLHQENESGVVMTEFAIAFPAQLFVTLAIMQLSLIYCGHALVQHAAFAAARAALTADVPPPGFGKEDPATKRERVADAARRAAAIVLSTIAPPDSLVGPSAAPSPGEISWKTARGELKLVRSHGAFGFTNVTVVEEGDPGYDASYVSVSVEHDLELVIPVVNHWFAGRGLFGSFWYGPERGHVLNDATLERRIMVLRIAKTGFLPRPWRTP